MEHEDLGARYKRLKQDLAKAYASSTWDSPYIRLAKELYEIENLPRVSRHIDITESIG